MPLIKLTDHATGEPLFYNPDLDQVRLIRPSVLKDELQLPVVPTQSDGARIRANSGMTYHVRETPEEVYALLEVPPRQKSEVQRCPACAGRDGNISHGTIPAGAADQRFAHCARCQATWRERFNTHTNTWSILFKADGTVDYSQPTPAGRRADQRARA